MACALPLMVPETFQTALRCFSTRSIPNIALQTIATYLWSSDFACVASRDGYLRLLFDGTSFVFQRNLGSALWCLCSAWGNLYVSLWGGAVQAFGLCDDLPLQYQFRGSSTLLCLCSTTRFLCAGSDIGCFYVFSPQLVKIKSVAVHAKPNIWFAELNCCLPASEMVLLGSDIGILYRVSDFASVSLPQIRAVRKFRQSMYCLRFNGDVSVLFAGLGLGVDALCPSTFETLFHISANHDSVWSISVCPGENAIVLGTRGNGILVVKLRTDGKNIPRSKARRRCRIFCISEIGTCSAISHALNGSCYAASNNSRIYYFRSADEINLFRITSRFVALPVVESGDLSQTPRRDIYDVLCISNNIFGDLQ